MKIPKNSPQEWNSQTHSASFEGTLIPTPLSKYSPQTSHNQGLEMRRTESGYQGDTRLKASIRTSQTYQLAALEITRGGQYRTVFYSWWQPWQLSKLLYISLTISFFAFFGFFFFFGKVGTRVVLFLRWIKWNNKHNILRTVLGT